MQLDRIVVGMDFSDPCIRAVEWVARVLAPDAAIVLAHVIESPGTPSPASTTNDESREERERRTAIARLGEIARNVGVPLARLEVAFGPPAMGLAAVADGYSADLVVLGAHRSRAGLRTWLGGTAEQLLGIARAPVLVVAQVADGLPRRVLAAATDPLLAARVRDWADGLAQRFSASEMVMTMSHAPARPTVADAADLATDDTGTELHILTEAERCRNGIIVLGCRGAGRGDGAPLDGATTAVLRRATCPVIALAEPPLA